MNNLPVCPVCGAEALVEYQLDDYDKYRKWRLACTKDDRHIATAGSYCICTEVAFWMVLTVSQRVQKRIFPEVISPEGKTGTKENSTK